MAAYTPSLRLTLPVTGTDDGTWGDTVNNGITSLTDASIAGTATVIQGDVANYTLTSNSGATDQARNMFLNITGALTAARNVICPTASKLYFIKNSTTGGFAVTLKTSAGTGISVPAGSITALYCDGTNVVDAITYANIPVINATTVDTTNLEVTNIKAKDGTASITLADTTGIATFSKATVISTSDATNAALRITQTGAGNAFVVEDAANPDASPFVIDPAGVVLAGFTTTPAGGYKAYISGSAFATSAWRVGDNTDGSTSAAIINLSNTTKSTQIAADPGNVGANTVLNFAVDGTTWATLNSSGYFGIGTTAPLTTLNVNGTGGELLRISVTSDALVLQEPALGFALGVTNVYPAAKISALEFDVSDARASMVFYTRGVNTDSAPTEAMRITSAQVLSTTNDALIHGLTVGMGAGALATNTAVGASALVANTTGINNTATGSEALRANTTGFDNTATGQAALYSHTTGVGNTATGQIALYSNSTGGGNTANGGSALFNATGNYNTAVGSQAGYFITTGANNTILGRYDGNQGGLDIRTASNHIVLSDGDGNPRIVVNSTGLVGIGTVAPTSTLSVTGTANVTGNVTLGDATTDTVTVNGYMGVGGAGSQSSAIRIANSGLAGANQHGVLSLPVASSTASNVVSGIFSQPGTAAATFTVTNTAAFYADNLVKGAGSTITNQHGLYISDQTQGTNNYGITSLVSSGTNKWNIYASGTAANYFAGNVGIGTTSPTAKLDIGSGNLTFSGTAQRIIGDFSNATIANRVAFQTSTLNGNTPVGAIPNGTNNNSNFTAYGSSDPNNSSRVQLAMFGGSEARIASDFTGTGTYLSMTFHTGGSERVRIDTSGNLLVGGSTQRDSAKITCETTSNGLSVYVVPNLSSVDFAVFRANAGALCGNISRVGTTNAVTYASASDYRLKENIAPMTGALSAVAQLKPVTYTWKDGGSAADGFIAHELAEVCPSAVVGGKDEVDADGNPKYQSVDSSFLVATLTAAIQEQQALIATLTARITALEAK